MLLKKFRSSSSCCLSCSHINYWYLHKDHSVKGGLGTSHSTQIDVHSEQLKLIPALYYTKSMLGKVCVREIVWTSAKKATVSLWTVNAAFHPTACRKTQPPSPCTGFHCAAFAYQYQFCAATAAAQPSQRNLSGRAMSLGSAEFRDVGVGGHGQRRISEGWEQTEIPNIVVVTHGKSLGKGKQSAAIYPGSREALL